MKARVAVGVFLAFLPVLAFAQSTTAQQLLQALLPPNAVTPQISAPISAAVAPSIATPSTSKATLLQSLDSTNWQNAKRAGGSAPIQSSCVNRLLVRHFSLSFAQSRCESFLTRTLALGSSGTDVAQLATLEAELSA
jgi:hypothetical protein